MIERKEDVRGGKYHVTHVCVMSKGYDLRYDGRVFIVEMLRMH